MVDQARFTESAAPEPDWLRRRLTLPAVLGAAVVVMALLLEHSTTRIVLLAGGSALFGVALTVSLRDLILQRKRAVVLAVVRQISEQDTSAVFVVGRDDIVQYQNHVALDRYGDCHDLSINRAMKRFFASSNAAVLRMQRVADVDGVAHEVVPQRRHQVRITTQALAHDMYVWRFETLAADVGATPAKPKAEGLPYIAISRQGAVISQNDAMRSLLGRRALAVEEAFADPPAAGTFQPLQTTSGPVDVLVVEPVTHEDHRELYVLRSDLVPRATDTDDLETLPVPVLELSETGTLRRANAFGRELLALDRVNGQRLEHLVEGLGRPIEQWLKEAATSPRRARSEVVRVTNSDSDRYLQITLSTRTVGTGPKFMAVLQDATELKTLEAQFVQSQKMQAIGQLAGGVAHDFNNLLTAISGHCDLLLLRHDPGDPDYPDLEQINQNSNRAASLVSQLLAYSRKQTLRPELVDLRDSLADLSHLLNRLVGEKIALELHHDPNQRLVRADRRQLEQVIMNLVVNARDAMSNGGRILIETREERFDQPLHRDHVDLPVGDYVVVSVRDNGCGIPPDRLQKIFEPFYTTKRQGEGTGLGLSTAYGIVKQSGGFIFAESEVGQGTVFTLYFPSHAAIVPVADTAPPPVEPALPRTEGVILLVEDEAPVRAFAARALRLRGLTVLEADNAEAALAVLADVDTVVDVFVTDVIMPGMDGPTWVQQALESRPTARVVFMSGYAEESFSEAQDLIPNSVFLPKPFSLSQLTAIVQEQLAGAA